MRVSSTDQNEDRQRRALADAAVPQGASVFRPPVRQRLPAPQYQRLVKRLRAGDLLCVPSIDRLGRNYEDIQNQWRLLTRTSAWTSASWTCPSWTPATARTSWGPSSPISSCKFSLRGPERTGKHPHPPGQGIAAARARGIHLGRPRPRPQDFDRIVQAWQDQSITLEQALQQAGWANPPSTAGSALRTREQV